MSAKVARYLSVCRYLSVHEGSCSCYETWGQVIREQNFREPKQRLKCGSAAGQRSGVCVTWCWLADSWSGRRCRSLTAANCRLRCQRRYQTPPWGTDREETNQEAHRHREKRTGCISCIVHQVLLCSNSALQRAKWETETQKRLLKWTTSRFCWRNV